MQSPKSKTTCKAIQTPRKKLVAAIVILVALAAGLSITPATAESQLALSFVAFWITGAIATTGFILFSSRSKRTRRTA